MNSKMKTFNLLIKLSFYLYFLILIVERALSVSLSFANGVNIFQGGFNIFTYLTVFVSILAFLVYFIWKCRDSFNFKDENPDYTKLCIASGILLLSGMVHTEYTISGIQFASYGILIAGILLRVIMLNSFNENKLLLWFSFSYLVAFSMAIPVMYRTHLGTHVYFHVYEGITSYLLVGLFTLLMVLLFKGVSNLFLIVPFIIMVVLDSFLIAWRWPEEINFFVLIFASLSSVLFIVGFILSKRKVK